MSDKFTEALEGLTRQNKITARVAFEAGYKACERNMNIQAALAWYDELTADTEQRPVNASPDKARDPN